MLFNMVLDQSVTLILGAGIAFPKIYRLLLAFAGNSKFSSLKEITKIDLKVIDTKRSPSTLTSHNVNESNMWSVLFLYKSPPFLTALSPYFKK